MTVAKTHNRKDYTAGAPPNNKTYVFDFKIYDEADLLVYVNGALKVLGINYTVSGGPTWSESGGNVVFVASLVAGDAVLIYRQLTATQGAHWPEGDPFPSASHENAADRLVMLAQQFKETIGRVFKVVISSLLTEIEVPEGAGKLWGWNALGTGAALYNQIIDTGVITMEGDLVQGGVDGVAERLAKGSLDNILMQTTTKAAWKTKTYLAELLQAMIKLDDLTVPDDNTDLNVSFTKHGLCPKAPNDPTKFFRGDAIYAVPSYPIGGWCSYNPALAFGNGSGGDVVISADTTLSDSTVGVKIMQYNNLTVDVGKYLTAHANDKVLVILVKGTLTLNGTIKMDNRGGAGAVYVIGGEAGGAGAFGGGGGGGSAASGGGGGGGGETGRTGATTVDAITGMGGGNRFGSGSWKFGGGAKGAGGNGKAGGTAGAGVNNMLSPLSPIPFEVFRTLIGGGGGAGANVAATHGGVGAGGIWIEAASIIWGGSGLISANGASGSTNAGVGGGAGAGGAIQIAYSTKTGTQTLQANAGAVVGDGGAGANGIAVGFQV